LAAVELELHLQAEVRQTTTISGPAGRPQQAPSQA
jgi:hypothetical protein